MAKRFTPEISAKTKALLERQQHNDPFAAAGELARAIFDQALAAGMAFEPALGAIWLAAIQAYEEQPKRKRGKRKAAAEEGAQ